MPKVSQTSKIKVSKGTKIPISTSANGKNVKATTTIKAKVHKKR